MLLSAVRCYNGNYEPKACRRCFDTYTLCDALGAFDTYTDSVWSLIAQLGGAASKALV